jgi:hypothetical protein
MIAKRLYLICASILSLLAVTFAWAQAPTVPPDVQAILNKAQSGQSLTDAESKRMDEWGNSVEAAAAGKNPFAGATAKASAVQAAGSQNSTPCPPARASLVAGGADDRHSRISPPVAGCPQGRPAPDASLP